jgi:hypothetical protein
MDTYPPQTHRDTLSIGTPNRPFFFQSFRQASARPKVFYIFQIFTLILLGFWYSLFYFGVVFSGRSRRGLRAPLAMG